MDADQLRRMCAGGDTVDLIVPYAPTRDGSVRLAHRQGPRGEVICVNRLRAVARFESAAVLRWLDQKNEPSNRS